MSDLKQKVLVHSITILMILGILLSGGILVGYAIWKSGADERTIEDGMIPLARLDQVFTIPIADSPGVLTKSNERVVIDYSNTEDGYVTVHFTDPTYKRLKLLITGPGGNTYIYDLDQGINEVFPLSEGDGRYDIYVYEYLANGSYESVLKAAVNAELSDETAPFLRPSQYVDYDSDSQAVIKAAEITENIDCFFDAVDAIFMFVSDHLIFDFDFAEVAEPGYIPDVDLVFERGAGICFDYAVLAAAMLRSQGIPTKLVVGYYDDSALGYVYHAWISVYSEIDGQVNTNISFSGGQWNLMDPTLTSRIGLRKATRTIGDGSIYRAMYHY